MKRDLISIEDLSEKHLRDYLELGKRVEGTSPEVCRKVLAGRILGVLFYEPSTRTRLSFEAAMLRMGGQVIGFSEALNTSVAKGESLADTIHTVEQYCDAIVIRHPREGAARLAAEVSRVPVINAGDGANQHPTQTLLDLYTLQNLFGRVDGLRIALVGDLKYSRTVHSLFHALARFKDVRFRFVSPETLKMPEYVIEASEGATTEVIETTSLEEAISDSDVVYMTRIQRERFPDPVEYEKVKDAYRLDRAALQNAPAHLKVLHPLPRVNEIATEVDSTPHAAYFPQAGYGMTMRQGILAHLLGGKL
ncbi:MAG: aspartate carbamoyltransferase [Candidatus Riflebacteria bacterium HGW-Riflebacteria-2]|jgi:aspartate carbamoyltransferase catalytic subunit|nr:MAG: aspartate carbamoyltransferase [Candidatus Riflebacteria bacterium HGW-Riflebacteria-2]